MKFQIKTRFTDEVLYECDLSDEISGMSHHAKLGFAVRKAVASGINLRGADLRGAKLHHAKLHGAKLHDAKLHFADLHGSDLRGCDLRGCDLRSTKLYGADLRGSDLRGSELHFADLHGAKLRDAKLRDAKLHFANLRGSDLRGCELHFAELRGSDLRGSDLRGTKLYGADLRGAELGGIREIPIIPSIHQAVYEAASRDGALDMKFWHHACGTTHCRAGWVVTLAGEAGRVLEKEWGTDNAAVAIYMISDPALEKIPDFFCDNTKALADMKRLADMEASR